MVLAMAAVPALRACVVCKQSLVEEKTKKKEKNTLDAYASRVVEPVVDG
jgi:hypothetical protein